MIRGTVNSKGQEVGKRSRHSQDNQHVGGIPDKGLLVRTITGCCEAHVARHHISPVDLDTSVDRAPEDGAPPESNTV